MRLYLSSYRLGNQPGRLVDLIGPRARVRVIANGLDGANSSTRQQVLERTRQELEGVGFEVKELDLRLFFSDSHSLLDELREFNLVWATGGNAFTLNAAIRESGLDLILRKLLHADALAYGGYSAGAVIASPSLEGIELVDSAHPDDALPAGYAGQVSWDGLSLVDYLVVPHFRSDHWEAERIEELVRYCRDHGIRHRPLRDGEVLVVEGAAEEQLA